jgi:hypothetical protein
MSSLPELPPLPPRTRPLPPGGLEAAISTGRVRRHRALAAAGGATTALSLVVAAVLSLPGARSDSLTIADGRTPAPSVTGTAEPQLLPEPSPSPAGATPGPGASGSARPSIGPSAVAPLVPPPLGPDGPDGRGPGRASAGPSPGQDDVGGQRRPAYREDTDEDAEGPAACRTTGCTYSEGGAQSAQVVRRGEQATAAAGECTPGNDVGDRVYFFNGGQEKEVVVRTEDTQQEVFRFSATVTYVEGAHERRLRPGRCIEWTGRWNLVRTDGSPVPAGQYRMTMTVTPDRYVYENGPDGVDDDPQPLVSERMLTVVG